MHARAIKRHREYEIVYLLAPSTTPGRAEKVGDAVREVLEEAKGKLLKVNLWGIRTLAYRIKGNKQGIYYYMRFVATQGAVDEIERRLKLADVVLRYLTVRLSKHEVDPAEYTVQEEEAAFKGIDDLHATLQERGASGDDVQEQAAPGAGGEEPAADSDEKTPAAAEAKPAPEPGPGKDEAKPAGDDEPEVEVAPEPKPEEVEDKDAEKEEKS